MTTSTSTDVADEQKNLSKCETSAHEPETTPAVSADEVVEPPNGEYSTGRVICEICGTGVSFRDQETGGFTLKQWNEHRLTCISSSAPQTSTAAADNGSMAPTASHPVVKRRRAKRTEEERIEYLREDPYVAKFEAYRVLCASCNKWIRLRPNSTFCSIPWDAHRKSCLSKKTSSNNLHAFEERNSFFSQDPYARKFDVERVLCNKCDKWISIDPEDHARAVQTWIEHRDACLDSKSTGKRPTNDISVSTSVTGLSMSPGKTAPPVVYPAAEPPSEHQPVPDEASTPTQTPSRPSTPPTFYDLNPSNYAVSNESRKRNADQRAATLRSDALIAEVEPNRVFCSMCKKWVQLRQDSSFCAYPWVQHRAKCLARHQKRSLKVGVRKPANSESNGSHRSGTYTEDDDPESEEGVESNMGMEDDKRRTAKSKKRKITQRRLEEFSRQPILQLSPIQYRSSTTTNASTARNAAPDATAPVKRRRLNPENVASPDGVRVLHPMKAPETILPMKSSVEQRDLKAEESMDVDADADAEGESYVEDPQSPAVSACLIPKRLTKSCLADLDSANGRRDFLFASVAYLFGTTYEPGVDDMPISALLAYLNAAIPQDKFEDFDTCEVVRGVMALQKNRPEWARLEGDILRVTV